MKFKFKINENTTLEDIQVELEELKLANVKEIPFNHLRKLIDFLGSKQVTTTGSSLSFFHELLLQHPQYHGHFSVHKIHKGGDQVLIKMTDYKAYLYKALITIIELKKSIDHVK